jgi:hypothetical protein
MFQSVKSSSNYKINIQEMKKCQPLVNEFIHYNSNNEREKATELFNKYNDCLLETESITPLDHAKNRIAYNKFNMY